MVIKDTYKRLLAPALLAMPLAFFKGGLALPVQCLVLGTWLSMPLCMAWKGKFYNFSFCTLFIGASILFFMGAVTSLPWILGLALFCAISLWIFCNEDEASGTPLSLAAREPTETISIQAHKEVLKAHQRQYEQAKDIWHSEQDRHLQYGHELEKRLKGSDDLTQTLKLQCLTLEKQLEACHIAHEEQASLRKGLEATLDKMRKEYDDLNICYRHINDEWQGLLSDSDPGDDEAGNIDPIALEREKRRYRGLYRQLKEQFAEKAAILDATRRELFDAQEKLGALELEASLNKIDEAAIQLQAWHIAYSQAAAEQEALFAEK